MTNEELILNHLIELKKDVGNIDGKLDEIKDAHGKRLDDLEDSAKWQWRISAAVIPITGALHAMANKLGWRI